MLFDFSSRNLDTYASETLILDLRKYLTGNLKASGVFFGLSGMVTRRFTLTMEGKWSGNKGTLNEDFCYNNGEIGNRFWSFDFNDNGTFTATAPDVVGQANGAQCGNAAVMSYQLKVHRGQREIIVTMEDWLYLLEDMSLINRARMSKFGFKVGEVFAAFQKIHSNRDVAAEMNTQ